MPLAPQPQESYGALARLLHWTVAVLVVAQAVMGLIMVHAPEGSARARVAEALQFYSAHKVLGLVLLALVLIRLANRVLRGVPPEDASLATHEREAATLVHSWLYFLLLAVPLLGWIGVSLYPALDVFGVTLPALMAPDRAASDTVFAAHRIAALVLLALIALHVAAALYHYVIRRDGVLARMLPSLARRGGARPD